jgi:hypothetical protein
MVDASVTSSRPIVAMTCAFALLEPGELAQRRPARPGDGHPHFTRGTRETWRTLLTCACFARRTRRTVARVTLAARDRRGFMLASDGVCGSLLESRPRNCGREILGPKPCRRSLPPASPRPRLPAQVAAGRSGVDRHGIPWRCRHGIPLSGVCLVSTRSCLLAVGFGRTR